MGCGSSSNADAVQKVPPKAVPFSERLGKIEYEGDPEECIADMRLLRRKRELKPRGFIAKVIFKGRVPEETPPSEDEDLPGNKADKSRVQSTNGRSVDNTSKAGDTRRSGDDDNDNQSQSQQSAASPKGKQQKK